MFDKERKLIKYRIYQEACYHIEDEESMLSDLIKDLEVTGRDLKRSVMLDTNGFSFWANPDNGKILPEQI